MKQNFQIFGENNNNNIISEYKVSELSNLIKRNIEDNFGYVKVRGEVSNYKQASSGHAYFNLKENDAILACTCWRHVLSKQKNAIIDGVEILATGKLTTYQGQSRYQLSVENIDSGGEGALMKLLLERKEKFRQEGLFNPEHKKKIPFFPTKVGVITSPSGAVIKDILHRIEDRCPIHVIIWPVSVQGENAAAEISQAINGFNLLDENKRPDVIIIARGGGSVEDLWSFNEEIVVRSVFASKIPIISAVGHETDTTLIDYVSDKRAPTPTAAAEFAVPVITDLVYTIENLYSRLNYLVKSTIRQKSTELQIFERYFKDSDKIFFNKIQKLDELSFRLNSSLPNNLKLKISKISDIKLPYNAVLNLFSHKREKLELNLKMIFSNYSNYLKNHDKNLSHIGEIISSLDVNKILARGFAILTDSNGQNINSVKNLSNNFSLRLKDGRAQISDSKIQVLDK